MEKYNTYGDSDAVERRIDLAKNFRSHENILAATNFLFYQIMTEEAAELNYTEAESLIPGRIVGGCTGGLGWRRRGIAAPRCE